MYKTIYTILLLSLISILTGCGSSNTNVAPKLPITKQVRFTSIDFNLNQRVTPDIQYHTQQELKELLNQKIIKYLKNENLLSTTNNLNDLKVVVNYSRRFLGDGTPLPSDSLAYPELTYSADILNASKKLRSIKNKKIFYNGGMLMNAQVALGGLRDKKYELEFIDTFAKGIAEDINKLMK